MVASPIGQTSGQLANPKNTSIQRPRKSSSDCTMPRWSVSSKSARSASVSPDERATPGEPSRAAIVNPATPTAATATAAQSTF